MKFIIILSLMEKNILQTDTTKLSGKEQTKLKTRIRFYTKLERICKQVPQEKLNETLIPISINNKVNIPTFDDATLILEKDTEIETIDAENKMEGVDILQIPYVEEVRFLTEKSQEHMIKLVRQETFLNDDNTLRKGSSSSNNNYNYQTAYRWGFKILDREKFLETINKEKEHPTAYAVEIKMKKLETNVRYRKAWRPPQRKKH